MNLELLPYMSYTSELVRTGVIEPLPRLKFDDSMIFDGLTPEGLLNCVILSNKKPTDAWWDAWNAIDKTTLSLDPRRIIQDGPALCDCDDASLHFGIYLPLDVLQSFNNAPYQTQLLIGLLVSDTLSEYHDVPSYMAMGQAAMRMIKVMYTNDGKIQAQRNGEEYADFLNIISDTIDNSKQSQATNMLFKVMYTMMNAYRALSAEEQATIDVWNIGMQNHQAIYFPIGFLYEMWLPHLEHAAVNSETPLFI